MASSTLPTSRGRRLARLGGLAARLGGNALGHLGTRITSGKARALESMHRRAAEQLFETMAEMKGLPMKVGQILSFMDGVVPPEHQAAYAELLARLQVRAKPMAWEPMAEVLEAELGRPVDEVFARFEREPVAAASIGQVYRAELEDPEGARRVVAVKVQYPGIAEALRADLANAGGIAKTLHGMIPGVESEVMITDFLARIGEECDYRREAENMREFAARWQGEARVHIPGVVDALCTERVLVTEFVDALSFEAFLAQASPAQRDAAGEVLFDFVMRSLLREGLFNADPHPGNFLFTLDPEDPELPAGVRVVFLDFGCVQHFDPEARAALRSVARSILAGERGEALWRVLREAMQFPEDTAPTLREIIEDYVLFCFEPAVEAQPYRYTRDYTSRLSALTFEAKKTIAMNLLRIGWREPKREGLVLLSRILFGLNSVLASLEARGQWAATLSRYAVEA